MTQHTPQDSKSELENIGHIVFNAENEYEAKKLSAHLIEAYVTTRVKEAELLARIDEWNGIKKHSGTPPIRNHNGRGWWQIDWKYVEKRIKALTTTTNGKEE